MLLPVPAEEQVERLLDSGNLDQAMALAEETLGALTRSKSSRLKALRCVVDLIFTYSYSTLLTLLT